MNTSSKNIILGLAVVGIILVSLFMLTRSDRRVVLSISGFQTPTEKVTIGGGASGICYTDVPENYMEVEYKPMSAQPACLQPSATPFTIVAIFSG